MVQSPAAVIFDLGGVMVELGPLSDILGPDAPPSDEFWTKWLHSDTVREFESGQCSTKEFGDRLVNDFEIPFDGPELVRRFRDWPKGLFPGATTLLTELGQNDGLVIGVLSNSNPLHWHEQRDADIIRSLFNRPYLSFEMQLIKPDAAIFDFVAADLNLEPGQILYFDDNQINVDGARAAGWSSEVTNGPTDCRRHLASAGLVNL